VLQQTAVLGIQAVLPHLFSVASQVSAHLPSKVQEWLAGQ
jgi:hypothetical protein